MLTYLVASREITLIHVHHATRSGDSVGCALQTKRQLLVSPCRRRGAWDEKIVE